MANNNKNGRKISIPNDAKEFAKLDFKKFKKKNEDYYDSKKELKKGYYLYLLDLFPKSIEFVIKYGYINDDEVVNTKRAIFAKINDPDFIKVVKKTIKNDDKIENIKLLPILIKEILEEAKKTNDAILANDPNAKTYDLTDLVELSSLILKKKIKKMTSDGIQATLAFDALSVIPCKDIFKFSQFYRVRMFYETLYEHAKTSPVDFEKVFNAVVDDEQKIAFIVFALLERKEKFKNLTDSQKTLYLDITNWCFNTMEKELKKNQLIEVIQSYINGRIKSDKQGKDGNRRYSLSSLSEEDYPRISAVVHNFIVDDESIKKYL